MGILEVLLADDYCAEELVLEGDPVEGFLHVLFVVRGFAEVVGVAVGLVVADAGVALFEVKAFLELPCAVCPLDVECLHGWGKEVADVAGSDDHVDHVGIRVQAVVDVEGAGGEREAQGEVPGGKTARRTTRRGGGAIGGGGIGGVGTYNLEVEV